MSAVKPCPFCGAAPQTGVCLDKDERDGVFALGYVRCINSKCNVRPHAGATHTKDIAEQWAINRWNIRAE